MIERIDYKQFDLATTIDRGQPVIITGFPMGYQPGTWSIDSLRQKLKERTFSVHEATDPRLDFRTKNFAYKLKTGDEFLASCKEEGPPYMYLRATGANFRKDVPNFEKDFPELVGDIDGLIEVENRHSNGVFGVMIKIWKYFKWIN